jgi:hypothetical protein
VLAPFYRQVAAELRAVDPGALIFVEPAITNFAHRFTMLDLGLERVVYSTHLYGDALNDGGGHAGDFLGPDEFAPALALGELEATRIGAAFWPGEWGYLDETTPIGFRELQYAQDMLAAQDKAQLGSAYWTYWTQGFPFTPPIRAILTRPTVFAVAGTPLRLAGNEQGLNVRWLSDGGITRLRVPAGWTPALDVLAGAVTVTTSAGGWVDVRAPAGQTAEVEIRRS